ncbi:MAG: ABC transporter ATP-binding protein [Spirochaetaceae bacterium]
MIRVSDIYKSFGHVAAVRGVSFAVDSGEVFGLLGPNGAGKTTVLRILTGYHLPHSGTASVAGFDVLKQPLEVKRSIGYLPEDAPVYGELDVFEYLRFVADAREIPAAERDGRVDWAVRTCGLEDAVHRPVETLSKGYRRRTALAAAVLGDPPILILDEPTSGLDPKQIVELRRLVRELAREKTVIVSTHILQEVEAVCDRVLILNEGRVAAAGTTQEIIAEARARGDVVFDLTLVEDDLEGVREALGRLPHLARVERLQESGDADRPLVDARIRLSGEISGEVLFDWAVSHRLRLARLEPRRYSLEDVFLRLTAGDPAEEDDG